MKPKKTEVLYGIRVDKELADKMRHVVELLDELGYDVTDMRRRNWRQLVAMFENGDRPVLPLRFMTEKEADIIAKYYYWSTKQNKYL